MNKALISDIDKFLAQRGIILGKGEHLKLRDFVAEKNSVGDSVLGWIYSVFLKLLHPKKGNSQSETTRLTQDVFQREHERFEVLSNYYGGLYRGAFVLNYLMGAFAVLAALVPYGFSFEEHFGQEAHEYSVIFTILELLIILVILLIHRIGATPHGEHSHKNVSGIISRRWHERWIEYRTLSERFRYTDLLHLVGFDPLQEGAAQQEQLGEWTNAYFAYRLSQTKPQPVGTLLEYKSYLLNLMNNQKLYHYHNAMHTKHIHHRLHTIGTGMFYCTFLACSAHLIWHDPILTLLSGALPAIGAAMHGILASGEFSKSADVSERMYTQISRQITQLEAAAEFLTVRPIAKDFHNIVMNEVLGWRVMFQDKNVPLA